MTKSEAIQVMNEAKIATAARIMIECMIKDRAMPTVGRMLDHEMRDHDINKRCLREAVLILRGLMANERVEIDDKGEPT